MRVELLNKYKIPFFYFVHALHVSGNDAAVVQPLFKRFCRCFGVSITRSPHLQVFNDPKSTFVVVKQFDQMFHIQAMPCVNVVLRWLWNGRQCQWCSNHNMKVHLIFRQDGAPPLPPRYNRRQTQSEKKKKSDSH